MFTKDTEHNKKISNIKTIKLEPIITNLLTHHQITMVMQICKISLIIIIHSK